MNCHYDKVQYSILQIVKNMLEFQRSSILNTLVSQLPVTTAYLYFLVFTFSPANAEFQLP